VATGEYRLGDGIAEGRRPAADTPGAARPQPLAVE
jgi:hypothetical protein